MWLVDIKDSWQRHRSEVLKADIIEATKLFEVRVQKNRALDLQLMRIFWDILKEGAIRADVICQVHDERFTDWVNRRISDLCKQLLEVREHRLRAV